MTAITQSQTTEVTSSGNAQSEYFDFHAKGIGYLNRIRVVGRGRNQYLSCTINVLRGSKDEVKYTKLDLNVRSSALKNIEALETAANTKGVKVLVAFQASDLYPEMFIQTQGDDVGKPAVVIKGGLLKIASAKVNGLPFALPVAASDTAPAEAAPTAPAESQDSTEATGTHG